MNLDSVKQRISDVLTHRPFDCVVVHIYDLVEGQPVASNTAAERLLAERRQSILSTITSESGKSATWRADGTSQQSPGFCYGACCLGPMIVVVGKPLLTNVQDNMAPDPIDSYFLDAVQIRVAEILGVDLTKLARGIKTTKFHAPDALSDDLDALDLQEKNWRRIYGEDQWLAVKEGTVVAHGPTRKEVEEQLQKSGVAPPVLYVPPKNEERAYEMFSIGI